MINALFNEFYWFGLLLSGFVVLGVLTIKTICYDEKHTVVTLLWFVPIIFSWYYLVIIVAWYVLKFIWYMLEWVWLTLKDIFC